MAGVAAAAVALGVTQLLAVFFGPEADARTAVGSAVIDLTPGPVKEWAIQTFGTADKLFLSVLVVAVIAALAAVTAQYETRRVPVGSAAIVLAGIAGCAAVLSRAGATVVDIVPTVVGTVCGVAVLRLLTSGRFTDAPESPTLRTRPIAAATVARDARVPRGGSADRGRRCGAVAADDLGGGRSQCLRAPDRSTWPRHPSRRPCSRKALRCRPSSPATTTSTGSTPPCRCRS